MHHTRAKQTATKCLTVLRHHDWWMIITDLNYLIMTIHTHTHTHTYTRLSLSRHNQRSALWCCINQTTKLYFKSQHFLTFLQLCSAAPTSAIRSVWVVLLYSDYYNTSKSSSFTQLAIAASFKAHISWSWAKLWAPSSRGNPNEISFFCGGRYCSTTGPV